MAETILIVDDEPEMVEFLETLLSFKGYQTLDAYSGAEGLQKARRQRPDLILLDLTLPDGDGMQILKTLRCEERTAGIPVLVVSGRDNPQARMESLQAGAGAFLLKPYHPQALLDEIEDKLKKE
ncbi:MAG: response regulator [Anaerolineales bacterium]|nr:response regulator [Anaerolineales bacterium]